MTFTDCPESTTPGLRFVGGALMDAEQFDVEGWVYLRNGWACSIEGIHRYAALREQRKQDRKSSWQARQEAEESHNSWLEQLIEEKA